VRNHFLILLNVGIDHRLLLGSIIGSFADQPSALSPVTESTIERTNTRLVGQAGTQKPHRNTQFTRTSTRRKMNSVLDGDERRGAYAPTSWLYFIGLVNIQRRSTGATYRTGSCPPRRPVRHDPQDSLSPARAVCSTQSWRLHPQESAPRTPLSPKTRSNPSNWCTTSLHTPLTWF
jgi:hypothetical protein